MIILNVFANMDIMIRQMWNVNDVIRNVGLVRVTIKNIKNVYPAMQKLLFSKTENACQDVPNIPSKMPMASVKNVILPAKDVFSIARLVVLNVKILNIY